MLKDQPRDPANRIATHATTTQPSHSATNPSQVVLPFTALKWPGGVAMDAAGDVFVTDPDNNRVLKLPAGSSTPTVLPFTGLTTPSGVAVDSVGNVYVADGGHHGC
jgi:serine/threonine protein kinase, bacterial